LEVSDEDMGFSVCTDVVAAVIVVLLKAICIIIIIIINLLGRHSTGDQQRLTRVS